LRAIAAIFRTRTGFNAQQAADLHFIRVKMFLCVLFALKKSGH